MNKNMVGKPVLDSERKPIEKRILRIPSSRIHIVGCEDDPLSQELVVKHEEGSIEGLDLLFHKM